MKNKLRDIIDFFSKDRKARKFTKILQGKLLSTPRGPFIVSHVESYVMQNCERFSIIGFFTVEKNVKNIPLSFSYEQMKMLLSNEEYGTHGCKIIL